jgi:hypothetical protein
MDRLIMLVRTEYFLKSIPAIAGIAGELRSGGSHLEQSICLFREPASGSELWMD